MTPFITSSYLIGAGEGGMYEVEVVGEVSGCVVSERLSGDGSC